MLKVTNIKTDISQELTCSHIAKHTAIPEKEILEYKVINKSIDARKKPDIFYNYSIALRVKNEKRYLNNKNISLYKEERFDFPDITVNIQSPVIVGSGPAGLFAGLYLAKAGAKPIIVERGECVDERIKAVEKFWESGEFSPKTNVQFGEGGAGTFSDGKLTTGVNDIRLQFIKEQFVKFDAPDEILYQKKPHIGTDKLCITVKNIRNEIIRLGGEVRFNTCLTDIELKNNSVCGAVVECDGKSEVIKTDRIILAIGHSARDTFRMLKEKNIPMERKTFSIGGRIEHLQSEIGLTQYGEKYKQLPAADYKLSVVTKGERGVYTFCMCPGGYVVASASEEGTVVTNGMSYFKRDGMNANSALLVTVTPDDIEGDDVLGGVKLQESIEKKAFIVAGKKYFAPIQTVGDFLDNKISNRILSVNPTYKPGTAFCNIRDVLPKFITDAMAEAIPLMDRKLKGFANPEAIITVPETRSSSPVRILRDKETLQSSVSGLYPCGEGAGYAGGIMSAALDGIKCAQRILNE